MMSRRGLLASMLLASPVLAGPRIVDALLVGDSLAYELGPRLGVAMRERGRTLAVDGRGGSSTRQWFRLHWFERAIVRHPSRVVLVSLGVNCTKSERPALRDDIAHLLEIAEVHGRSVLWLLPPPLRVNTNYLREAVSGRTFFPGRLALESDGIHPTHAGHQRWARLLVDHLWPEGT